MLKSLFLRHVAELQLSVEFRMQMPSSAVSVCCFLGQKVNEHDVSSGLSSEILAIFFCYMFVILNTEND